MKFKELSQLSLDDRERKLKELELELIKLNAQVATGTPPKNAGQLRRLKKDVARLMLLKSSDEKILAKKKPQLLRSIKSEPKQTLKKEDIKQEGNPTKSSLKSRLRDKPGEEPEDRPKRQ